MSISSRPTRPQIFAVVGLILAVAAFRILAAKWLPDLPNFSPLMAIAFCGGLFLPGVLAVAVPVVAIVLSDVGLSLVMGYPVFGSWQMVSVLCVLGAVGLGRLLARRETFGLSAFVGLLLASSLGFYLAANALAWMTEPLYARSLAGFVQAQTVGLPGFPPAWMFLRNLLASDLIFGGLILVTRWAALRSELPQPLDGEMGEHARVTISVK